MAEDTSEAQASEGTEAEAGNGSGKPGAAKSSYESMAYRYVTRSRKSLDVNQRTPQEQAEFYLSAAQVYATLELADAIRNSNNS